MGCNQSTLPTTWTTATLGEIAQGILSGGTPSTKNETFWQGSVPWITSKWLNSRLYLDNGEKFISEDAIKKSATTVVPRNNLIFATRVGVGKVAVNRLDLAINQDLAGILIDSERYDVSFLAYQLRCSRIQNEVTSHKRGATIQGITRDNLKSLEVFLPPLPEQRKITAVLGLVQQAIEEQERQIALTTELKKTLLHQLFTQGLRGEPQKETEIGLVPESWEVVTLGSLIEDAPQVSMRSDANREIEYIDVSSISREFLCIESTSSYVLKEAPGRARKKVKTGDVIFATVRPTLLRIARVPAAYDEQVCSTAFCVLRDKNKQTLGRYIYYLVQREEFVKQLASIESGASYPAVTDRQVKEQLVPVSQESEQIEIAATLEACDGKIRMLRRKHVALTDLFRTMLHQLMTAQVRVNDLDLSEFNTGMEN